MRQCVLRLCLPLLLALGALPPAIADDDAVTLGVFAYREADEVASRFAPLTEVMSAALEGREVRLEVLDLESLDAAVDEARLDFVLTNPRHALCLRAGRKVNGNLATLIRHEQGEALAYLAGVILARRDAELHDLEALKGQAIAIPGQRFLGGFMAQAYELHQREIDPYRFADYRELGSHDAVMRALLDGDVAAGFVRSGILEDWRGRGHDVSALEVVAAGRYDGFPLAHSTGLYPEWPLTALVHVPEDDERRVASALLGWEGETGGGNGLRFAPPRDYLAVEQAARALRIAPFADEPRTLLAELRERYGLLLWAVPVLAGGLLAAMSGLVLLYRRRALLNRHLMQERQALEQILWGTTAGTWQWNVQTGETRFNARWAEMIGYRLEEISPTTIETWMAFCHPDDLVRSNEQLEAHFAGQRDSYDIEVRMRHRDGHWIWVHDRGRVISWDDAGAPLWMAGTHTEITQRKEAENAFTRFFQVSPSLMAITDLKGRVLNVSSAWERVLGIPCCELEGAYLLDLIHPDDRDATRDAMGALGAGDKVTSFINRYRHRDGSYCDIEWYAMCQDGCIYGAAHDVTARLALARERHQERAFLQLVIDSLPTPVFVKDWYGRHQLVNEQVAQLFGTTKEAMLERSDHEMLGKSEQAEAYVRDDRAVMRSGQTMRVLEDAFTDASGVQRYFQTTKVPLRLEQPAEERLVLGIALEITQRKRMEEQIAQQERLYRGLVESQQDLIVRVDLENRFLYVNDAYCRLFGKSRDALLGHSFAPLVHEEDRPATLAAIETLLAPPHPRITVVQRAMTAHGWRWIAWEDSPIFDDDGKLQEIQGVGRDVTPLKEAELEAAETSAQLRKHAALLPGALYQYWQHPDGRRAFPYASDGIKAIYGVVPEAVREDAAPVFAVLEPADMPRVAENIARSERELTLWRDAYRVHHPDNGMLWIEGIAMPERLEDGSTIWHGYLRDVTGEHATQQQLMASREALERSNRELEQFAYAASHDLRQPLRMVTSYAQLLERHLAGQLDDDGRTMLHYMRDGAQRMDGMLLSLLDYSRVGRKGQPMQPMALRDALDEALHFLAPEIREAEAQVTVSGEWPQVVASSDEMMRLFQNLLSNAIKYRAPDQAPEITLAVEALPEAAGWQVSIRDNGIGIAADQQGRLFQVFQRLHTREQYAGTGVGLAICRKIVERHGGEICLESPGEGQGSTVIFTLPARDEVSSAEGSDHG